MDTHVCLKCRAIICGNFTSNEEAQATHDKLAHDPEADIRQKRRVLIDAIKAKPKS